MQDFYCGVLGLRLGPRPAFSFGGAWLYCQEHPVIHLVAVQPPRVSHGQLTLQHFAFSAIDLQAFLERLDARRIPRKLGFVADFQLCQVNLHDPDANQLHVDFPLHEAEALGLLVND
jgi:catechol 2,3-dioxygenase-like lactoylglutathione lyase family enzyme